MREGEKKDPRMGESSHRVILMIIVVPFGLQNETVFPVGSCVSLYDWGIIIIRL